MGNIENTSEMSYTNFLTKFEPISRSNDQNYGEGSLLKEKSTGREVFLKDEIALSAEDFKERLSSFQAKHSHPNIIPLLGYFTNSEERFCSRFYKLHLIYEFQADTLADEVLRRKLDNNKAYNEEEIWRLLEGLIYGLSYLQQMKISHGDLNPHTVLVTGEGGYKILNPKSFEGFTNSFARLVTNNRKRTVFLSPNLMKALELNNWKPNHDPYKSDVFCLGLTVLSAMSLDSCNNVFNYHKFLIYDDIMRDILENARMQYSSILIRFLQDMLILNEEKRPDFLVLRKSLEETRLNLSKQKIIQITNESTIIKTSNEKHLLNSNIKERVSFFTDPRFFSSEKPIQDEERPFEKSKKAQKTEYLPNNSKSITTEIEQDLESINLILDRYGIAPLSKVSSKNYKQGFSVKVSKNNNKGGESYDYQSNYKGGKTVKETDKNSYLQSQDYELSRPYELEPEYDKYEIVVENFSDNSRYEGEKIDDKRAGKGKMVYSDQKVYEGNWKQDLREGEGVLISSKGKEIYKGSFHKDLYQGKGRLSNENPEELKEHFNYLDFRLLGEFWAVYEGEFQEGRRHGKGKLLLSNGEKFEGLFIRDMVSGKGRFYKGNGVVIDGLWRENRFIKGNG